MALDSDCNWHVLQTIKAMAAERGAWVVIEREPLDNALKHNSDLAGWLIRLSDQDEPETWFANLPQGCVC